MSIKTTRKLFYLIILFSNSIFSQVTKDLPNYFPASPNASSFAKQGIYPVDYSTGKLNVGIPIYTIKTKELTVPISLSYNTSGIQLNETASWVGLGWNLNAGGAIVRNTKGIPDGGKPIPDLRNNFPFNATNYQSLYDQQSGNDDTAPDEFVVNAPGLSGSFYFDHTDSNRVLFRDFQNTKVVCTTSYGYTPLVGGNSSFTLTKDDGTIYVFGEIQVQYDPNTAGVKYVGAGEVNFTNGNSDSYQPDYISAWYLTKMISANGKEQILFNYKSIESHDYTVAASESLVAVQLNSYIKTNFPSGPSSIRITKQFLQSITFPNGKIEFLSTLDREDLIEDYKLNSIEVSSVVNNQVSLIQKSSLNYDYYVRSGGNTTTNPIGSDPLINNVLIQNSKNKSLRLKEVVNNALNTKYLFDYNATQLPLRGTTKQDYWGYINGNVGSLIIPTTMDLHPQIGSAKIISFGTGNRDSNEDLMKSGILEKITYPEGGYSVFEYESNKYTENVNTPTVVNKSITAIGYGTGCGYNAGPNSQTNTFAAASSYVNGSGKLYITFMEATQESGSNTKVTYDGETFFRPNPIGSSFPGQSLTVSRDFGGIYSHTISALENRSGNIGASGCPSAVITASWQEQAGTTIVPTIRFVGGLRIKSIKDYNGTNASPVTTRQYDYQNENVLNKAGINSYNRCLLTGGETIPVYSSAAIFNNNIGGGPNITYGKVIETEIDPVSLLDKGKTEYYFENIAAERVMDNVPVIYKHPLFRIDYPYADITLQYCVSVSDFSYYKSDLWNYGSLTKTNYYKRNDSNALKLLKSTVNAYTVLKTKVLPYNLIFNVYSSPYHGFSVPAAYDQIGDYNSAQFFYFSGGVSLGKKVMNSTIETDYDVNENPTTIKTTNYFFDNPIHNLVTRTETTNSKNEILKTQLSYPQDLLSTGQSIEMQKLVDQNRIDKPIKTETFVNNIQTSESITKYEESVNTGNALLPKEIHSTKGTVDAFPFNNANRKINFTLYDTDLVNGVSVGNGNVLEYSLENGTPVSVIWGYNKTLPIAKIENANYSQVSSYVIALQTASNNSILTESSFSSMRSNLPNAMVTTYTYKPLIGVSTITDLRGDTTYYEYDENNRLKLVKDKNGNIVSENQYHYKN